MCAALERVTARGLSKTDRSAAGAQVEQASGFAQIGSIEPFVEPLVNGEDDVMCPRRAGPATRNAE